MLPILDFSADTSLVNSDALKTFGGSSGYIDPLVANQVKYCSKSDIYSLGIVLWEMLYRVITGRYQKPFDEYLETKVGVIAIATILLKSAEGKRPTLPEKVPSCLADLVNRCHSHDFAARPEAIDVRNSLNISRRRYKSNTVMWDLLLTAPPVLTKKSSKNATVGGESNKVIVVVHDWSSESDLSEDNGKEEDQ